MFGADDALDSDMPVLTETNDLSDVCQQDDGGEKREHGHDTTGHGPIDNAGTGHARSNQGRLVTMEAGPQGCSASGPTDRGGGAMRCGGRTMTTDTGLGAIARSVCIFIAAGICEIGGGYLVWRWWREGAGWPAGLLGSLTLVLYGFLPTFQAAPFGRVYAAYGGVFVVMSLIWSRFIDGYSPDRVDLVGAALCLAGVAVFMHAP